MGSFGSSLNVSERLRPWFQAGVELLFRAPQAAVETNSTQPDSPGGEAVPDPLELALSSPPATFAPPWDGYWAKACKSARVVWTYMELGLDLGGSPNAQRGRVFRTLISRTGWPAGTSAFWPMSEPSGPPEFGASPRADMFWAGVARLSPGHVICCGTRALDAILPDAPPESAPFDLARCRVHLLPDPAELCQPEILGRAGDILAGLDLT